MTKPVGPDHTAPAVPSALPLSGHLLGGKEVRSAGKTRITGQGTKVMCKDGGWDSRKDAEVKGQGAETEGLQSKGKEELGGWAEKGARVRVWGGRLC